MKKLNINDLASTESDVLDRISEEFEENAGLELAGHSSTTMGHRSGSSHSSHSSAMKEKVKNKDK
jgi:hypothetical protein